MAKVCTLDGLNLNDKSLFWLMQGFSPGTADPTYDEFPSWNGSLTVRNVKRVKVVQLTLPIDVRTTAGNDPALLAGIEAINAKIRAATFAAPKTLVVGARSFYVIDSAEIEPPEDELWAAGIARLVIPLNRMP